MIKCNLCFELKAVEDYYPNSRQCKNCKTARGTLLRQSRRGRPPTNRFRKDPLAENFVCYGCERLLPRQSYYKDNKTKCGIRSRCIVCYLKETSPQVARDRNLRSNYGITQQDFVDLFLSQNSSCAICNTDNFGKRGPMVDHNHTSKKVRGVLCHHCNIAVGQIESGGWKLDVPQITAYLEVDP